MYRDGLSRTRILFISVSMVMLLLIMTVALASDQILGKKPAYGWSRVYNVPNHQAIGTKIWVPGLDEGYVPQGLTFADGQLLISLYQSKDPSVPKGPCRVYRVDPKTGDVTGKFDLPPEFGHADGLAYAGSNILYSSDTYARAVYKINLEKALQQGNSNEAILGKIAVAGVMNPAFLTYDGSYLWFGRHLKPQGDVPKIYKIDPKKVFAEWPEVKKVSPDIAEAIFEIGTEAQGATFDKDGYLWIAYSGSKWGRVQKIDPSNGKVLNDYELMAGLEDFACAPDGKLWSVSEAGAYKYMKWKTYYPLIFEMDTSKLR